MPQYGILVISPAPADPMALVAAGFYVLEASDLDTALRIAALNPATRDGGVEVRPLSVPPPE
jgi:hypothetical protein